MVLATLVFRLSEKAAEEAAERGEREREQREMGGG